MHLQHHGWSQRLSYQVREGQTSHDIIYVWNLKKKNDRNELIYKTEIDSERKQTYGYQKGKVGRDKLGILD